MAAIKLAVTKLPSVLPSYCKAVMPRPGLKSGGACRLDFMVGVRAGEG